MLECMEGIKNMTNYYIYNNNLTELLKGNNSGRLLEGTGRSSNKNIPLPSVTTGRSGMYLQALCTVVFSCFVKQAPSSNLPVDKNTAIACGTKARKPFFRSTFRTFQQLEGSTRT